MRFVTVPVDHAEGLVLAHSIRSDRTLKKGHVIAPDDIAALTEAGVREVTGVYLTPGDVPEDDAAARIASRLAGAQIQMSAARTGRCNLIAAATGITEVNARAIDAANLVDEAITIATLPNYAEAKAGQVVCTVKIIPFAVPEAVVAAVESAAGAGAVTLRPYQPRRFALISTISPALKDSIVASTEEVTRHRILDIGGELSSSVQIRHDSGEVAHAVRAALDAKADVILIVGASATSDRADVVPAGIVAAGGVIDHFGMPVDPGNLMVLAHAGATPVVVLPGCARSPKLNGFDWVVQRLAAGRRVAGQDIMKMGVGGLLIDIPSRPLPRERAVQAREPQRPAVAAIVLAAGQSRRMGEKNKLLMDIDGTAMVRRAVETVKSLSLSDVIVVTGHQQDRVRDALSGQDVKIVHNPRYAEGLSTSLKAGIEALSADAAGVLVCLADMPAISASHITRLIAGFSPDNGRAIGVPTHKGKRGNPVLWARRFFPEMQQVSGDVGARHLIGANEALVYEVEFDDTAVLMDLDTPGQWQDYVSKLSPPRSK